MIDVGLAIDGEAVPATVTRRTGSYDATGKFVSVLSDAESIRVVAQPLNGRDLNDMPEGVREESIMKFYSRSVLENGDIIAYSGRLYKVLFVWDRQQQGNHHRVSAGLYRP